MYKGRLAFRFVISTLWLIGASVAACQPIPPVENLPVFTPASVVSITPIQDLVPTVTQWSAQSTPIPVFTLTSTASPDLSSHLSHSTPDIKARLDHLLDQGGKWNVLVTGPSGDTLYERGAPEIVHPASTIKIAIGMLAMEMLVRKDPDLTSILDGGPPSVGRSYAQLLKAMIVFSEEDAAQALQDAVVADLGWKEIESLLKKWGAQDTRLVPRRSSAADLSHLLIDLYEHDLPSLGSSRYILRLMAEITGGDTGRLWKMKDLLPMGAILYNKRGTLLDPMVVADIGIVDLPIHGPYYLCILGYPKNGETYEYLDQKIGDFAVTWLQNQFPP